jgi:hypothetical protein
MSSNSRFLGRVGSVRAIGNDGLYRVAVDGVEGTWVQSLVEAASSGVSFGISSKVFTRSVTEESQLEQSTCELTASNWTT